MKISKFYQYFGDNGTFTSPIHIPNIPSYAYARLTADEGKILTDGTHYEKMVVIAESEVSNWTEEDEK